LQEVIWVKKLLAALCELDKNERQRLSERACIYEAIIASSHIYVLLSLPTLLTTSNDLSSAAKRRLKPAVGYLQAIHGHLEAVFVVPD